MTQDIIFFRQLISFLRLKIPAQSIPGFFRVPAFSAVFPYCPVITGSLRLLRPAVRAVFDGALQEDSLLHKSSYSSPAVAAVAVQVGFHRKSVCFLPGFRRDSRQDSLGIRQRPPGFPSWIYHRFRKLWNCTKKVCLWGILTNRNRIWRYFGSKKRCVR